MFFIQFILFSSSFVATLVKNEIGEAALELCQLNINQLSPDILKFRTKHKDNQDNPFTLNCFVVSRSFLFIFNAGLRGLGSNNFRNSSYKEKTAGSARVSRLSFRFLWLCYNILLSQECCLLLYYKEFIFLLIYFRPEICETSRGYTIKTKLLF